MVEEIWKRLKEYPNYEVSNKGRVRKGSFITYGADHGNGYKRVTLDRKKPFYVHRLVALAFIPNPENKPCVNHLDCNPSNNAAENLEWCTKKENSEYMVKLGRNKRTPEWINNHHNGVIEHQGKAIIGTNLSTGEEMFFKTLNSTKEAGYNPCDVCSVLKGRRKKCKNTTWRYAQDEEIEKAIERYKK